MTTESHTTALPHRAGPRPTTTPRTPHLQLDQPAPPGVEEQLRHKLASLRGVRTGRSGISAPSSLALILDREIAHGPAEAFMVGTEFAHLHGDGSGSLHLALPRALAADVAAQGWGELHPAVGMGLGPPTWVMVYGPRDEEEGLVVWGLIEQSHLFAQGPPSKSPGGGGRGRRA